VIVSGPGDVTAVEGQPATFQAQVTGTDIGFRWFRDGGLVAGASEARLTLASVRDGDHGARFRVEAHNAGGAVLSPEAALAVHLPASIAQSPGDQTVREGQAATFTVGVRGRPAPTVQWYLRGVVFPGATGLSWTTSPTQAGDDGAAVTVAVENLYGRAVSAPVLLHVQRRPVIGAFRATPATLQPGQATTLSWEVSGAEALSLSGVGAVTGSSRVVTPDVTTTYVLTASNAFGSTQAETTVTVNPAPPAIVSFTATPASIPLGGRSTLAWVVTGASTLTLSGVGPVTGTSHEVAPLETTTYTLTASSGSGTDSAVARVQVEPLVDTGVVVDHTCTDLSRIPSHWLDQAKARLRIAYQHTSHGSQLVTGLDALRSQVAFGASGSGYQPGVFLNDYGIPGASDLGNPSRTA